jgi:hypothetical protein
MKKQNGLASIAPRALQLALEALEAALLTRNIDAAHAAVAVAKEQLNALNAVVVQGEGS